MKKNEFMRILTIYTGLKQQQVSFLFKKFKISVLQKINPKILNKNIEEKDEEEEEPLLLEVEEVEVSSETEEFEEEIITFDANTKTIFTVTKYDENGEVIDETEDPLNKVISMEDFEIYMDKEESKKYKKLSNERRKENISK